MNGKLCFCSCTRYQKIALNYILMFELVISSNLPVNISEYIADLNILEFHFSNQVLGVK